VLVRLKLGGLVAEDAADAFANLQLRPRAKRVAIGESFALQVFDLSDLLAEHVDALIDFFDREGGLRPAAGFRSCHLRAPVAVSLT
jgi:hypothetical protein